jgi:hypothetical protein
MSLRHAATQLEGSIAAKAVQANPMMIMGWRGTVLGYNPDNHTVQVEYFHASDQPTRTQWMQIATGSAAGGAGEGWGPEIGAQVLVVELDPRGDDVVAIGFTFNEIDKALGIPASERHTVDKRGSYYKLTADGAEDGDGQGGAKVFGAGYAFVGSGGTTEIGAQNLDQVDQADIRFTDIRAYHEWLQSTFLPQWAALLQGGSGAPPPPPLDPPNIGSQTVRVAD